MYQRVGCYVRVSTENQIENYSIEEQIDRLKAYCKAKDLTIYKFYTDGGYSGGNLDRPALQQMLSDIQSKKIDMVIVYKLDRLSRSQKDTLLLIEDEFLKNDIDFISVSENFDTTSPFGRAMIGILSVFAQLEKDQITERFTMGRIGRGKAGYYHGGSTAPTGYDYINGELVVNEYISMQVQEVYNRFLQGYSANSITNYMHDKYGGWSSHALVLNVLRNSIYIGKVKFKKKEYDGVHQPIIDIDTFNKVQAMFGSPERENKKSVSQKSPFRAGFMLSSLIICDKCGARYSASHGYYKCYSRSKNSKKYIMDPECKNDNWPIEQLDEVIIKEIKKAKYKKDYLDSIFKKAKDTAPSYDRVKIEKRIEQIQSQIGKMIDLYQIGNIPIVEITKRVAELQNEKDKLENIILDQPIDRMEKKQYFIDNLKELETILESSYIEQKRAFIGRLINTIHINGQNIKIDWNV